MQNSSVKYILKLSIPIFFANLAIPMVGIIDTGLMGNLGNLSYLSATSVAANLFSMIFWSFGFLRMGTVGLVSQAYGKEDYSEIFNIILRNLVFVLVISLIIISLQGYIYRLSLNIFELSETTEKFYQDYFQLNLSLEVAYNGSFFSQPDIFVYPITFSFKCPVTFNINSFVT